MNLISIIIPIYNVEKYLRHCVDSVLNQTYENIEVILVDDGSPDKCGEICDEYAEKDERIRVIHKENGGLSDARNAGLAIATGEYVAFVDSDDYIEKDMYEKLYEAIRKANADMSICNFKYVGENGIDYFDNSDLPIKDNVLSGKDILLNELFEPKWHYWVVAWNKLYKRELFNDIHYPIGRIHEDEFVIHEILFKCRKVSCISKMLYNYVQRENSIVNQSYNIKRLDYIDAMLNRLDFFLDHDISKTIINKTIKNCRGEYYKSYQAGLNKEKSSRKRYVELNKHYRKAFRKLIRYNYGIKENIFLVGLYVNPYLLWKATNTKKYYIFIKYILDARKRDFILIDTPTHGNLGDHAIVMAEEQMILAQGKNYTELTAGQINLREKWLSRIIPSRKTILIHGGGFLGSIWSVEEERFRRILEAFSQNAIIVFPQTITFEVETEQGRKYFEESHRIYSAHKNLTVFVREKKSFEFMTQYMPEVNTVLVPDVVTYLDLQIDEGNRNGILLCMRSDREKKVKDEELAEIYTLTNRKYPAQRIEYIDTVIRKTVSVNARDKEVRKKLTQFKNAKLVITDRLHGMIFAAITNTPCIAIGNSNGKIKGVYEWIKNNKYVIYVDDMQEFTVALDKLDIDQKYQYDRNTLEKAFTPLLKMIG